jgi:hypothetical protein
MRAYSGSNDIAPLKMEVSGHIHGQVALPQVKESGFGIAKNLLPLLGFEPRIV